LTWAEKPFDLAVYPRVRHGIRVSRFKLQFPRRNPDFLTKDLVGTDR